MKLASKPTLSPLEISAKELKRFERKENPFLMQNDLEAVSVAGESCNLGPLAIQRLVDTVRSMNEAPTTFTVSSTKSHNLALSKKKIILGHIGE